MKPTESSQFKMPKQSFSKKDQVFKWSIISVTSLVLVILAVIVGFIIFQATPGFLGGEISIWQFLFTNNWNPDGGTYGIAGIVLSTMTMLFISLIIAVPLTIFSSLFISEYLNQKSKKVVITTIQLLAGIPSVVFGLFAIDFIGPIFVKMGASSSYNMMTASTTLAFMALPTMITLSINAIESVPESYRFASIGLGISKERTTHKIVLKSAMPKIIGAIIMGMARIIGETMAVILIAGNSTSGLNTSDGFLGFIFSSIRTLSGTIGLEMLENGGSTHQSALYAIGLVLFFLVIVINLVILGISGSGKKKAIKANRNPSKHYKYKNIESKGGIEDAKLSTLIRAVTDNRAFRKFESFVFLVFFIGSVAIIMSVTVFVIGAVIFQGLIGFSTSAMIQIDGQKSGIFATIFVTLLLVFTTIVIAIPLALFVAIYFNEYSNDKSKFTRIIKFAISILASTPSIVFGIFGLTLFVQIMGIPLSILAASLTMTMVILPSLIISFEDALSSVPNIYREAAYGMGMRKSKMVFLVVLPNAMPGLLTGTILSTARIVGESAPVYLTLGTVVRMPTEGFMSPGATLTTEIYMLVQEGSNVAAMKVAYQLSFITLLFILLLNALSAYAAKRFNPEYKKPTFDQAWMRNAQAILDFIKLKWLIKIFKKIGNKIKKWSHAFNYKNSKENIKQSRERKKIIKEIYKEVQDE
ncbi:phosphate ABC transporter permease [Spiroplasma sp. TIUS-1]|uniref:phosphate ABC transporter permease PstA n=1 Tax=Spiroplasma sp. TIUS-1 TaxID=216963 RepID=UPI0013982781|nr:phosphate ABC transporter permease PstA [Spiroplasma sp. TIUS-1]QHX35786.1 phosphate ABC transporter permease [Spiroplasma sp. TIUS-1]